MKYSIEILTKKLQELNKPLTEDAEEDLIGAVLNNRQRYDLKLALKILHDFVENSKALKLMS